MRKVCWICDRQYDAMLADAKKHYPLETGGVLVGYKTKEGEYVVTEVIFGGPEAKRKPFNFEGDTKWQREQCDAIWERTHGTEHYIGDWHTHPDNSIHLSSLDVKCLRVIAEEPTCLDDPLMVVLEGKDFSRTGIFSYPEVLAYQGLELRLYHSYSEKEVGAA